MGEHTSTLQNNINFAETLRMVKKAPAIANRIFDTLADAQAYVDDINDSATEGIRITVLNDSDTDNNGVYYVKQFGIHDIPGIEDIPGILIKICRGNAAWFKGNAVSTAGSTYHVNGAEYGDMYLNTKTLNMYTLKDDDTWALIGNMLPVSVNKDVPYYILSVNGTEHPEFNITEWTEGEMPTNYEDFVNDPEYKGQLFMWTRFYDSNDDNTVIPRYVVSMVYSSLNLGTFSLLNE